LAGTIRIPAAKGWREHLQRFNFRANPFELSPVIGNKHGANVELLPLFRGVNDGLDPLHLHPIIA
jgi:hypothetical protein